MRITLTDKEREIACALGKDIRTMDVPQVARTWWSGCKAPVAAAKASLRRLSGFGLVLIQRAPVHPELDFLNAASSWAPGLPVPEFGSLAYRLQSRWQKSPVLMTTVSASKECANMFSGYGGRVSRDVERTHDIHLARVYLLYRLREPSILRYWVFEDRLRKERGRSSEMLPDAILRGPGIHRAVEFGGAYSKEKLEAFHSYCAERNLPYEIW